jgi:hypothetical protein
MIARAGHARGAIVRLAYPLSLGSTRGPLDKVARGFDLWGCLPPQYPPPQANGTVAVPIGSSVPGAESWLVRGVIKGFA